MPSRYLIYALQDPVSWELRYVGRSSSGLGRPIARHHAHCEAWRCWLRRRGLRPIRIVLQEFPESTPDINSVLNAAEAYWIAELRRRGCPLTNVTDGGGGIRGWRHSTEERAKISAGVTKSNADPLVRAKISAANRGRRPSAEARAKMSAARRGKKLSAETLKKLLPARKAFRHSAESREKLREAWRRRKLQIQALLRDGRIEEAHRLGGWIHLRADEKPGCVTEDG